MYNLILFTHLAWQPYSIAQRGRHLLSRTLLTSNKDLCNAMILTKINCNLLAEHESHQFDSVGSVRNSGHVVNVPHHWQNLGRIDEFSEVEVFTYHG